MSTNNKLGTDELSSEFAQLLFRSNVNDAACLLTALTIAMSSDTTDGIGDTLYPIFSAVSGEVRLQDPDFFYEIVKTLGADITPEALPLAILLFGDAISEEDERVDEVFWSLAENACDPHVLYECIEHLRIAYENAGKKVDQKWVHRALALATKTAYRLREVEAQLKAQA